VPWQFPALHVLLKSGLTWLLNVAKSAVAGSVLATAAVNPGAVPIVSVHGDRYVLAGGGPEFVSDAPLAIHRAST